MLSMRFKLEGLKVAVAPDVDTAIALHEKHFFPVVLTDIRMPGKSGVDLIRAVKEIHPTCIVYVMTGYAKMENLVDCLELGAVDYLMKPFEDLDHLVHSIKQSLKRAERWRKDLIKMRIGKNKREAA